MEEGYEYKLDTAGDLCSSGPRGAAYQWQREWIEVGWWDHWKDPDHFDQTPRDEHGQPLSATRPPTVPEASVEAYVEEIRELTAQRDAALAVLKAAEDVCDCTWSDEERGDASCDRGSMEALKAAVAKLKAGGK